MSIKALVTVPLGTPPVPRTLFLECATVGTIITAYPSAHIHEIQDRPTHWFLWPFHGFPAYSATAAERTELATHGIEEAVRTRRTNPPEDPIAVINERQQAFESALPDDILTAEVRTLQGAGTGNPEVWLGYRGPTGFLVRVELPIADNSYTWIRLSEDASGRQGSGNLDNGVSEELIAHLRGFVSPGPSGV